METILHYIQELQRMADDLAGGVSDVTRYEEECESFFARLEEIVGDNFPAQASFLEARLTGARANMAYLLRQQGDMERHQSLVKRGLDGIYQSLKNPPLQVEADDGEGDYTY
ncbi:MAG: hypothetical protein DI628_02005 [Blastochloris viridis]|uniref:Flagellar protein FliT n=1 Tax=Blastochloris viridis TaxID=1079 RepID=A0A6N4RDP2_BLAVI|nr:MAG: hypothetical protein DI628_02005 [Blastochloris viridis]